VAKVSGIMFVIPVRDLDAASAFYCKAFDLQEVFRNDGIAFVGLPGSDSALGLLHDPERAGSGPQNVGFHLDHSLKLDEVLPEIEAAGGTVVERGEHALDVPFARIADPDGNVIEV
jgi:predicted enzyme related to lactoylglutathione lyase